MDPFSRFASYFLEVARSGSLRKAAERLYISGSAINRQILMAEESLGVQLFERLPSGMKLTTAGEMLFDDLNRWRHEYERTCQRLDDLQGLKRGHVSVALVAALSEGPLVQALADICAEYPGLSFDLNVQESHVISELVAAAEVDFGLLLDPEPYRELEIREVAEIPVGAVLHPQHELAGLKSITPGQMAEYRHLFPAAPLIVHDHIQAAYNRVQTINPVVCNDVRMVKSLARQQVGIGVLSKLDVLADIADGSLVFIPFRGQHIRPMSLVLCVAQKRQLSRAAQLVMQACQEAVRAIARMPV